MSNHHLYSLKLTQCQLYLSKARGEKTQLPNVGDVEEFSKNLKKKIHKLEFGLWSLKNITSVCIFKRPYQ